MLFSTLAKQASETVHKGRWELFSHKSDIGVRGFGRTKEIAFEQAAMAMTAVITNPDWVHPERVVAIACDAPDDELLLADWLNAVIYESARRQMLFSRFEVKIDGLHLRARMWGEKVNVKRHCPAVEIKGATYTELRVHLNDTGWMAQCIVDV